MIGRILLVGVGVVLAFDALWVLACEVGARVNRWRWRRAARDVVREATDLAWEAEAHRNPIIQAIDLDEWRRERGGR